MNSLFLTRLVEYTLYVAKLPYTKTDRPRGRHSYSLCGLDRYMFCLLPPHKPKRSLRLSHILKERTLLSMTKCLLRYNRTKDSGQVSVVWPKDIPERFRQYKWSEMSSLHSKILYCLSRKSHAHEVSKFSKSHFMFSLFKC